MSDNVPFVDHIADCKARNSLDADMAQKQLIMVLNELLADVNGKSGARLARIEAIYVGDSRLHVHGEAELVQRRRIESRV